MAMLPIRKLTDLTQGIRFIHGRHIPYIGVTVQGSFNIFVNKVPQSRFPSFDIAISPTGVDIPLMGIVNDLSNKVTSHTLPLPVLPLPAGIGHTITSSINCFR